MTDRFSKGKVVFDDFECFKLFREFLRKSYVAMANM